MFSIRSSTQASQANLLHSTEAEKPTWERFFPKRVQHTKVPQRQKTSPDKVIGNGGRITKRLRKVHL